MATVAAYLGEPQLPPKTDVLGGDAVQTAADHGLDLPQAFTGDAFRWLRRRIHPRRLRRRGGPRVGGPVAAVRIVGIVVAHRAASSEMSRK
jgi:hypothetical protein